MSGESVHIGRAFGARRETAEHDVSGTDHIGANAVKAFSAMRVLFGAIFLFDGILKWILIQQGTMQATVAGVNVFNYAFLSNHWLAFGVLIALGETFGGLALVLGLFQRPAALWSAAIMLSIWAFSGYDGLYANGAWSLSGYTDPGGDLMLALVFVVLIFAPYAYGVASRFRLRERLSGDGIGGKLLRFLAT